MTALPGLALLPQISLFSVLMKASFSGNYVTFLFEKQEKAKQTFVVFSMGQLSI